MNYAIEILETEKRQLEYYPVARKKRDKKLKDINQALEILTHILCEQDK